MSWEVIELLRDILCLISGAVKPAVPFSTRNPLTSPSMLCPNDGNIRNRAVCNPGFSAVQNESVPLFYGTRAHISRIGAVIRLGESETANLLTL